MKERCQPGPHSCHFFIILRSIAESIDPRSSCTYVQAYNVLRSILSSLVVLWFHFTQIIFLSLSEKVGHRFGRQKTKTKKRSPIILTRCARLEELIFVVENKKIQNNPQQGVPRVATSAFRRMTCCVARKKKWTEKRKNRVVRVIVKNEIELTILRRSVYTR